MNPCDMRIRHPLRYSYERHLRVATKREAAVSRLVHDYRAEGEAAVCGDCENVPVTGIIEHEASASVSAILTHAKG